MSERQIDEILLDLARHPGWAILEQRVAAYQEAEATALGKTLIRGEIDQRQLDRARGFWAGQRWLLRQVKHELSAYRRQEEATPTR